MTTRTRTFRCEDDLWNDALTAAAHNGEVISDVLRASLEHYVADTARQAPRVARLAVQLRLKYPQEPVVELVRIIRSALIDLSEPDDDAVRVYAGGWIEGRKP